jgi:hypothetical protein
LGDWARGKRKFYDQQAKERQKLSDGRGKKGPVNLPDLNQGDARDAAGAALGVSGKSVDYASHVLANGCEELIAAVEQDEIAVSTAARLSPEPPEEQRRQLASLDRSRRRSRPSELDGPLRNRESYAGAGAGSRASASTR